MQELYYFGSQKIRLLVGGFFVLFGIVALIFIFSVFLSGGLQQSNAVDSSANTNNSSTLGYENPNIVAIGMGNMAQAAGRAIMKTEAVAVNGMSAIWDGIAYVGVALAKVLVGFGKLTLNVLYDTMSFVAMAIGKVFGVVTSFPGKIGGIFLKVPIFQKTIQPASYAQVPVIDTQLAELYPVKNEVAQKQEAKAPAVKPVTSGSSRWPIQGRVTAHYGVPHLPYQRTHTGIDISSGQRSGVTPVHSFRAGTVVNAVYSWQGLGNHIVVDHGAGLTSVYAHLSTITVKVGQHVDASTILGYEGSTGMSTGPHVHFEIRQDGQTIDPHAYIEGHP